MHEQLSYIRSKDLGLDRENVVFTEFEGDVRERFDTFRAELLKQPGILSVAASNQNPMSVGHSTSGVDWAGKDPDDDSEFNMIQSNAGFLPLMAVELKGRQVFLDRIRGRQYQLHH